MNEVLITCLLFLVFVRLVGLIVSIDFFYDTREHKFKMLILGWVSWMFAGIIAIFLNTRINSSFNEILLVFNILFGLVGSLFIGWGLVEYYISLSHKFMELLIVLTIVITLLLYLIINLLASMIFGILVLNIAIITAFIVPPLRKKKFKTFMGKSIRWYYITIFSSFIFIPVSVIISMRGYGYGVYEANDSTIILAYYLPPIIGTLLMVVLFVHLEYSTSRRLKDDLKDKYSHNLGNIMQMITSATDLSEMQYKQEIDILPNLLMIKDKTKEAANLIKQIRKL